MSKPKILFVCHNHPDLHPGGTEIFSHGLFQALKAQHGLDAVYLACVNKVHRGRLPGTLLQSAGRAADEILLWAGHFDRFSLSQVDLHGIVPEFERLLLAFRPDIVHFHHVLLMGVEALQVVRRVLPEAGILLTLHDYYPICANDGQMVTTRDRKLCRAASADACASCFPETSRDRFVMRELFIKQNLSLVDRFISPSEFLKRRYIEWGLPADRIDVIGNGVRETPAAPHRPLSLSGKRDRLAFFGHLNPFKGALVAIDAAKRLAQRTGVTPSLTLHGSADFQTDEFKAELAKATEGAPFVVARGRYSRDELPSLMAEADWVIVPSIWWENAPLIIQEAFQHRRPVICSGIGGMAEAVHDGVDGLWFNVGDPRHLSDKMEEALNPDLWMKLVSGIKPPRRMSESADEHLSLYQKLGAFRRGVPFLAEPIAAPRPKAEAAQSPVMAKEPAIEPAPMPQPAAPAAVPPPVAPALAVAEEIADDAAELERQASDALAAICADEALPTTAAAAPPPSIPPAANAPAPLSVATASTASAPVSSFEPVPVKAQFFDAKPAVATPPAPQPEARSAPEPSPVAEMSIKPGSGHRLRRLLRGEAS